MGRSPEARCQPIVKLLPGSVEGPRAESGTLLVNPVVVKLAVTGYERVHGLAPIRSGAALAADNGVFPGHLAQRHPPPGPGLGLVQAEGIILVELFFLFDRFVFG